MTGMISVAATQAPTGRAYFPTVKYIIPAPIRPMMAHRKICPLRYLTSVCSTA
jgi:hypothetical protein